VPAAPVLSFGAAAGAFAVTSLFVVVAWIAAVSPS
jgi:hypothetical protein